MKMNRNKGFVLLAVVSLIALIPTMIMLMSRDTAMMVTNNKAAQLSAQCHTILLSGFAWIEKNSNTFREKQPGWETSLDVSDLHITGGACTISLKKIEQDSIDIQLDIECSNSQRKLKLTQSRTIERITNSS